MCVEDVAPLGFGERLVVSVDQHRVNDELSGWAGSNRRKPRGPKPRALPTELHPGCRCSESSIRSNRVTVRADELALCDLIQNKFTAPFGHVVADLSELHCSRQVIPLHGLRRERTTAVCAPLSGLQFSHPRDTTPLPGEFLLGPTPIVAKVVVAVVGLTAGLAPRLVAVAAVVFVEFGVRLDIAALRTTLHLE